MRITESQLKRIISEEIEKAFVINEALVITNLMSTIKSIADWSQRYQRTKKAAKGSKFVYDEASRALEAKGILEYVRSVGGETAKEISKGASLSMAKIAPVEFAAIMIAIGVPALALWSLERSARPENQIRFLSSLKQKAARNEHNGTGSEMDMGSNYKNYDGKLTWDDISDPLSERYSQTYSSQALGRSHAMTELVMNQDLANELYEDEIISDQIMNWARTWWRDLSNVKQKYLREKYLARERGLKIADSPALPTDTERI